MAPYGNERCRRRHVQFRRSFAAISGAGAHLLPVLRGPFRADLPHVSYAMLCGVPAMAAEHLQCRRSGRAGRPSAAGVLADRSASSQYCRGPFGAGAAIGAIFIGRLGEFYLLAVVFARPMGGVRLRRLAREYSVKHSMGTVFGAATMTSSLGMAFGRGRWLDIRHL